MLDGWTFVCPFSSPSIKYLLRYSFKKYDCLNDWQTEKILEMLSHLKTSSMENVTRAVKFSGAIFFMILVTIKLPANWCQKWREETFLNIFSMVKAHNPSICIWAIWLYYIKSKYYENSEKLVTNLYTVWPWLEQESK